MRLLIVEDNEHLTANLAKLFRAKGYAVDCANRGEDADAALHTQPYDLVILDLGLPDIDGLELLRRIRRRKSRVPVLILTARESVEKRVEGLNEGADDYLGKPFSLAELEARAGALIRRGVGGESPLLRSGRLTLDTVGRVARIDGVPIDLPRRELCLLELLSTTRPDRTPLSCTCIACARRWSPRECTSAPFEASGISWRTRERRPQPALAAAAVAIGAAGRLVGG